MNAMNPADAPKVASAGQPLEPGRTPISRESVIDALRTVFDPEIPVNIYDLGLIYELGVEADGSVMIEMTLTAPNCPVAGDLPQHVADAVAGVPGSGEVSVYLVWDPPWTMAAMSDDAKLALNLY
ncbi:MAG: DUF59 domain-containing protein [Telmatospirillum sp.]|nr:DUF59 domain-containing protein [Telmatospirillum sp.]